MAGHGKYSMAALSELSSLSPCSLSYSLRLYLLLLCIRLSLSVSAQARALSSFAFSLFVQLSMPLFLLISSLSAPRSSLSSSLYRLFLLLSSYPSVLPSRRAACALAIRQSPTHRCTLSRLQGTRGRASPKRRPYRPRQGVRPRH